MEHGKLPDVDVWTLWNPWALLLTLVIILSYYAVIGPLRNRFPQSSEVSKSQKRYFILGMIVFYTAVGSPLEALGHHYLFTAHMIQQGLMYLAFPPLILLGLPVWFLRPLLQKPSIKRAVLIITHPLIAVVLFNALFSFYHMPFIFDFFMMNHFYMNLGHFLLVASAFIMWWNVTCPLPEFSRLSELQKLGYIFANGVLLTPACALMIFAGDLLYTSFANAPVVFEFLSPLDDQQSGGVIMKIMQEIIYGFALYYVFNQWYKRERSDDSVDPIPEHNLAFMGPPNGGKNQ